MHLSQRFKKRLAAAAAIVVLFFILTSPAYHSARPGIGVNGTSGYYDDYYDDYYDLYYGNATAVPMESWVEFHSPLDWMGYYYCTNRTALQVGVFVLGFVGEGGIVPEEGDGNHPADAGGNAPGEGGTAQNISGGNSNMQGSGTPASGGDAPGEEATATTGQTGRAGNATTSGSGSSGAMGACYGFISPLQTTGELDPYGHGWNVCYGFRLAVGRSCAY